MGIQAYAKHKDLMKAGFETGFLETPRMSVPYWQSPRGTRMYSYDESDLVFDNKAIHFEWTDELTELGVPFTRS